jgi:hypothetical protein
MRHPTLLSMPQARSAARCNGLRAPRAPSRWHLSPPSSATVRSGGSPCVSIAAHPARADDVLTELQELGGAREGVRQWRSALGPGDPLEARHVRDSTA